LLTSTKGRQTAAFSYFVRDPLVGGGEYLRLHQLHRLAAALDFAVAGLDAENFRVAVLALESLA
jgi:hypothetical protein